MYPSSRLIGSRTKAPSNLLLKLLRAGTGGAFSLATGTAAQSTSAQVDKRESELKAELKSATKTMLGSIAPSLRDAIDVESVSKEMLAELQAQETILKLKSPEDITLHTVGTEAYWHAEYVTVGATQQTFDVCINAKVDGAYKEKTNLSKLLVWLGLEEITTPKDAALAVITEQCGTINLKGHSVEREGGHRIKTYELFYGMLNKMVPPYEDVVAVDTPVEDMTEKEMLKEILMRERNRVFGLSKQPKLFFVITAPDTSRTQSDFAPMIDAMNRAEAGAAKITNYTDKLIDSIPIPIPILTRALKKGAGALAERELGKELYHIGGTLK